jgi:hypothetical protein
MKTIEFPFDIDEFFKKCVRHKNIPKNDFEKQAVLLKILEEFEDNKRYSEPEVNDKIKKYFEDFASVRRELINFSYMQRDPQKGEYWVVKRTLTEDDIRNNTLLRRHAKPFKVLEEDRE